MGKTNAEICKAYYYRRKAAKAAEKRQESLAKKAASAKKQARNVIVLINCKNKTFALGNRSYMNEILSVPPTTNSLIPTSGPSPRPVTAGLEENNRESCGNESMKNKSTIGDPSQITIKIEEYDRNQSHEDHCYQALPENKKSEKSRCTAPNKRNLKVLSPSKINSMIENKQKQTSSRTN